METEHVTPGAAARLQREGVHDPDQLLTELVNAYAEPRERESGRDPGRTAEPERAPAEATVRQRPAVTPAGGQSEPVREHECPPFAG